jgi:membrane-associated progesterone receptor component
MGWLNFWSRSQGTKDDEDDEEKQKKGATAAPPAIPEGEMRKFTSNDLTRFRGENGGPIYVSVKNKVYDCTSGAAFYGPGKTYAVFAGREASRCLGKMLISDEEANANWDDLLPEHMQTLNEWDAKFESKYPIVGTFEPDEEFFARQKLFTP